jgi:hypothetical protein
MHIRPTFFGQSDDSFVFLNWKQRPLNVGKYITSFFKSKLGIHISSNRIRAIVETSAEDLLLNGSISPSDRASVCAVNGHSSSTMRTHYLKRSRVQDALNVSSVVSKMVPSLRLFSDQNSPPLSSVVELSSNKKKKKKKNPPPTSISAESLNRFSNRNIDEHVYSAEFDPDFRFDADNYFSKHYPAAGSDSDSDSDSDYDDMEMQKEALKVQKRAPHPDIGKNHPDIAKITNRIPWSKFEINFVGK